MQISETLTIFAENENLQDMNIELAIELPPEDTLALPTFTSTVTVTRPRPKPEWITPKEAAAYLSEHGLVLTTQTLFNLEKSGRLHTRRKSQRKVDFDLNEIRTLLP